MSGWRRWAVVALPFVIGARALLLVFQIYHEHHTNPPQPPSRPVQEGEAFRFTRVALPGLERWEAGSSRRAFVAGLLERDGSVAAPGSGCLLSPVAMARAGGTLTLHGRDAAGFRLADWRGGATVSSADTLLPVVSAKQDEKDRQLRAAMLTAADCGSLARLSLSDEVVDALVELLNGRTPTIDAVPRQTRQLVIHVDGPPP